MKERIQKVLANAGVASRRNVEEMVLQGRVAVNGKVVTDLPVLIDPDRDRVTVDGENVRLGRRGAGGGRGGGGGAENGGVGVGPRIYLLLNKPRGVYSTNVAQGEQVRAIDLLPPGLPGRVYPVGQLDAESRGLLLLTNDGALTNQLTHPRYGVPKTYRAVVDGDVRPETVQELEKGVWLPDAKGRAGGGPRPGAIKTGGLKARGFKAAGFKAAGFKSGRSRITVIRRSRDKSVLEITLREGRSPHVRRTLAKLGHKVRDLMRVKMGPLTLEGLAVGHVRALTPREVRDLRQLPKRGAGAKDTGRRGGPDAEGVEAPARRTNGR